MQSLTLIECLMLAPLIALAFGIIIRAWLLQPSELWSPLTLFTALMLYYMIIGPLIFVFNDQTVFLGYDYRSLYWKGWLAALVAYVAFIAGYSIPKKSKRPVVEEFDDPRIFYATLSLGLIAFFCITIWAFMAGRGLSILNPVASEAPSNGEMLGSASPFLSYFLYGGNLIIPGLVVVWLFWLDSRWLPILGVFAVVMAMTLAFYINTGFRFRIAWLAIALTSAFFLWRNRRPNILLFGAAGIFFLMGMGLIGMTRNYFSGLSLEGVSRASATDFLQSGFSEAGIFTSVCAVVDAVPEKYPLTYFDPIIITAAFPVPSMLWPDKPRSETTAVMAASFENSAALGAGQAVPYFGEWYIAFWWPGLAVSSLLFGVVTKKLWLWYGQRMRDKLATTIYCTCLGYVYYFFGRGYLPQTTMNFCFTILPLFLVHHFFRKRPLLAKIRTRMLKRAIVERVLRAGYRNQS